MKKICAISDILENCDVIRHGQNEFICSSVKDFIALIRECQMDKNARIKRMKDNAYIDVMEKHNTVDMAKKYSKIYREEAETGNWALVDIFLFYRYKIIRYGDIDSFRIAEKDVA